MTATARGKIARLALGRDDVYVVLSREPEAETDVMIGDAENLREWSRLVPGLAETAVRARPGLLFLVRPRAALEAASAPRAEADL